MLSPRIVPLKRFFISPPFGNYAILGDSRCTRIMGSFTLLHRPGLVKNTIKTVRPIKGGYVNKVGLRNCGLINVKFNQDSMYSLIGMEDGDWDKMYPHVPSNSFIEINLGCPNVHGYTISEREFALYTSTNKVSAKLPPEPEKTVMRLAEMCVKNKATFLHLSNTIP